LLQTSGSMSDLPCYREWRALLVNKHRFTPEGWFITIAMRLVDTKAR
jgi:hypothetical protein